ILCIQLASPLSCAKRFLARRFGSYQMVAMVRCSDLTRPDSWKQHLNFFAATGRKNKTQLFEEFLQLGVGRAVRELVEGSLLYQLFSRANKSAPGRAGERA